MTRTEGVLLVLLLLTAAGFLAGATRPGSKKEKREELPHRWLRTQLIVCEGNPEKSIIPTACWQLHFCPEHKHQEWRDVLLGEVIYLEPNTGPSEGEWED